MSNNKRKKGLRRRIGHIRGARATKSDPPSPIDQQRKNGAKMSKEQALDYVAALLAASTKSAIGDVWTGRIEPKAAEFIADTNYNIALALDIVEQYDKHTRV